MIKRVWAKFDGMDLSCVCDEHHRKCQDDACKEYVVKFMEIDRTEGTKDTLKHMDKDAKALQKTVKKFESEISKSIRKLKFKI